MKDTFIRLAFSIAFVLFAYAIGTSQRASPAQTTTGKIGGAEITIDYSAPSVKGRKIWGGLVPYGEVWRTGANETTVFTTTADIKVKDTPLKAGKYGLYTIPGKENWTVIFSKKWDTWGTNYDENSDALRVEGIRFSLDGKMQEQMVFKVNSDNVELSWDTGVLTIPISSN